MPETRDLSLRRWLHEEAKYGNVCFLSWASGADRHARDAAHALKGQLTSLLRLQGWSNGQVYLAQSDNKPGEDWFERMKRELCGSVVLVAICTPDYHQSKYCSFEWQLMEELEKKTCAPRILPVSLCKHDLPPAVTSRHLLNQLDTVRFGGGWTKGTVFAEVVQNVAEAARLRAEDLRNGDLKAHPVDLPRRRFPLVESEE